MNKSKFRIEIGERLRSERIRLNLKQESMAEKIDVSLTFYGEIERGNKGMSAETLYKIKTALDINIDYLLTGTLSSTITEKSLELMEISPQKARCFNEIICLLFEMGKL